jgi:hypothetical protein
MEHLTRELALRGYGAQPTTAVIELNILTRAERMKRAGAILGAGVIAALIALPIPLVHFVFVPGALITGMILAVGRLNQEEVFRGAQGRCPYCGAAQEFTVLGRFKLPKKLHCEACQRELTLEAPTT